MVARAWRFDCQWKQSRGPLSTIRQPDEICAAVFSPQGWKPACSHGPQIGAFYAWILRIQIGWLSVVKRTAFFV